MVRKTKEETEQTRINLLNAALDVFSTKGFVRSTLAEIAKTAGVTRGAIYWHFKDKAALFNALSDYIDDCAGVERDDFLNQPFTSLDDIADKMCEWLQKLEDDEQFRTFYEFVNFKLEYHEELDEVLAKERALKRRVLDRFMTDYGRFKEEGKIRSEVDPRSAALSTMAFVHGLVDLWLFDHGILSISKDARPMIDNFLASYVP